MPYTTPAAVVSGAVISKTTFGDVVIADLNFLANPPACRVYHNANQSIADVTETTLAFNSERYDTDTMHDTVTNNSRITIKTAGVYIVTLTTNIATAADYNSLYALIRLNGATPIAATAVNPSLQGGIKFLNVTTVYKFAVNDYVEARVLHDNTANAARNVETLANWSPEFAATWIGLG